MSDSSSRPLITFAVCAYNHARFVRECIEGAFAQTYSPLQIILSDDCSLDGTYDIMRGIALTYRGPHQIVLNQNPANVGLAGHCNRIAELAKGEILVMGAGDDISLPHRVEACYQAWEVSGRKAGGVHGRVINIDENGHQRGAKPPAVNGSALTYKPEDGRVVMKDYLRTGSPVILGCTTAWHRSVFDRFGPLPEEVVYEDMTLGFRARLLSGMVMVNAPLVLYRLHGTNIHHAAERATTWHDLRAEEERNKTSLLRKLVAARSFRVDLEKAQSWRLINEREHAELLAEIEGFEKTVSLELEFRNANSLRRLILFPRLATSLRQRNTRPVKLRHCLPRWSYYAIRLLKARLARLGESHN